MVAAERRPLRSRLLLAAEAGVVGASHTATWQHSGGWADYGQRAPTFVDCSPSPCDNIAFRLRRTSSPHR